MNDNANDAGSGGLQRRLGRAVSGAVTAQALLLGLATALTGVLANALIQQTHLEEGIGLHTLFWLRGPRPAPEEVVVVAIDRDASDALDLPYKTEQWPRVRHAELVQRLAQSGARVVVFDLHFKASRDGVQDRAFADALGAAGNVVLFEYLQICARPNEPDCQGAYAPGQTVVKRVPPLPELAAAAAAVAPQPLPKWPLRKFQSWLFVQAAGDAPTMPVVAFQRFVEDASPQLMAMLDAEIVGVPGAASEERDALAAVGQWRQRLQTEPDLARRLQRRWHDAAAAADTGWAPLVGGLIDLHRGPSSRYLDFYGPARSITTVPYHRALWPGAGGTPGAAPFDFEGKAVFVGVAEDLRQEQGDAYPSPFATDVSGVEFAATAFANLLEGRWIEPLSPLQQTALVLAWGLLLGTLFLVLRTFPLVALAALLAGGYATGAYAAFAGTGVWVPTVVPLLCQVPFALTASLVWHQRATRRERDRIFGILNRYLPHDVVDEMMRAHGDSLANFKLVDSVCLETDAEQYTRLSEQMSPQDLGSMLIRYHGALLDPIKRHGGLVSDIVGDAVLAVWETDRLRESVRGAACHAALDVAAAVEAFNREHPEHPLPTRIGLHCGEIVLGNVGSREHFEYRAVGDTVNTTARIEGLNAQLGTRILASDDVIRGLPGFVTRELGSFRLAGKRKALRLHELVGRVGHVGPERMELCAGFSLALASYREQRWQDAVTRFASLLASYGEDGPTRHYLALCEQYVDQPPPAPWTDVIEVARK